jgi:hypothetical protein
MWREVDQLMLASFDASGHESDQPFLVVGGFVSSAGDWDEFSDLWLKRLREDGLPYFHASQFASGNGIFDGWKAKEARTRALAADLMDIIVSHAFRYFVHGVKPAEFNMAFTDEDRETFNINAYALCGRTCVADLGRWIRRDSLQWDLGRVPDLVFEHGDKGKGKLRDMLVKHNYPEPQFLPGKIPLETKLGAVPPYVPLQAADWIAYESFRLLKLGSDNRDEWRWPMRQFVNRMQGVLGFWSVSGLNQVKDDLAVLNSGTTTATQIVIADPLPDGRIF